MDKVSDFFSELTARMRSPFFFSFVFSWTVYNWKVPLSIILYSKNDLKELGYKSHFDFIDQFGNWQSYVVPLSFAILYTLLSPGIKAVSTVIQAWFKKKSDKEVRDMNSNSWLPMSVFLRRQDAFQKQQANLNQLLADEIKINTELQEKTNYNNELLKENSELKVALSSKNDHIYSINKQLEKANTRLDDRYSLELMNGYWSIKISHTSTENRPINKNFVALISDGNVAIADSENPLYPDSSYLENVVILPSNDVILIFHETLILPRIAKYSSRFNDQGIIELITQDANRSCTFTRAEFVDELKHILSRALRDD